MGNMSSAVSYKYGFVAGNLALDFVNTVAYRFHPQKMKDHLENAEDVRHWVDQASVPERDKIKWSSMNGRTVRRIRDVREQLFEIFHAIAQCHPIPQGSLQQVSNALSDCRAQQYLAARRSTVSWTWRPMTSSALVLLNPILSAATDLLTSNSLGLVRQCADEHCGWLFLDRSNARKRRWCTMADCGNRNKARKHYRLKASGRTS
jgi:predicted RNA-binding Zn ribbon-like protein